MSTSLLRYGPPTPPDCQGYVDEFGTRVECVGRIKGTTQCHACAEQQRRERGHRERHLTERLQRTTYGPAPDDVDPFEGF